MPLELPFAVLQFKEHKNGFFVQFERNRNEKETKKKNNRNKREKGTQTLKIWIK